MFPLLFFIVLFLANSSLSYSEVDNKVLLVDIKGPISVSTVHYVKRGIKVARENRAVLMLLIDTPGGYDEATREIVKDLLNYDNKVITYVYPRGARCASAGLFILVSGDYACMATGTNVGSAHPVTLDGKADKVMMEKITQDALGFLESVSRKKGHYNPILREMVLKSRSLTESEALNYGIINCVADSIDQVLANASLRNARLVKLEKNFFEEFLSIITHPNVAYFLLLFGFYGILLELYNPGSIFPGVFGAICFILALYALNVLSINWAGFVLVFLSFIFFILEIKFTSHGLLALSGVISLILGSIFMFYDLPSFGKPDLISVSIGVLLTLGFFFLLIYKGFTALRRKPVTGVEGLIGLKGVSKTRIDQSGGLVFVRGELWKAYSDSPIEEGEEVEVVSVEGLKLKVKKVKV